MSSGSRSPFHLEVPSRGPCPRVTAQTQPFALIAVVTPRLVVVCPTAKPYASMVEKPFETRVTQARTYALQATRSSVSGPSANQLKTGRVDSAVSRGTRVASV
jgi:hypothetical protein